jgi:outer membrane protein
VKLSILAAALTVALAAPSFAQTQQPPTKPVTPSQPPTTTPPGAQQPAAPKPTVPMPPAPFPQDAKYAVVDVQAIAQNSTAGKEASKRLNDLQAKKMGEIQDKNKQLQALQAKQQASGVLSEAAKSSLDKEVDRLQRDIQFSQSNAQAEMQDLNNELQAEFTKKVAPIIEEIAKEKGLYLVFTADSGFAYVHPGLNISDEVIKRLDSKKDDTKKDDTKKD